MEDVAQKVLCRVKDPRGIDVEKDHFDRGKLVKLPADVAMQLYRQNKVSYEDFRLSGMPPFTEKRNGA